MAKTRSDRKRQTRLAFTPLPSSSPGRASQPAATRDRAAAVTIEGSPSPLKRRKVEAETLPTPTRSSQRQDSFLGRSSRRASSPATRTRSSTKDADTSIITTKQAPIKRPELEIFDDSESSNPADEESASEELVSPPRKHRSKPVEISDSGSDNEAPIRKRRLQRKRAPSVESDSEEGEDDDIADSDDSDDLPVAPHRRKDKERKVTLTKLSRQDKEDLDEDLDFLEPTCKYICIHHPSPSAMTSTFREDTISDSCTGVESPRALRGPASSPHKLARQKALDALKRRRSRLAPNATDADADAESDEEHYSEDYQSEVEDETDPTIFHSNDYDEDFIDDENAVIGEKVDLPLQFSNHRTMKLKELFKFVVEWMVRVDNLDQVFTTKSVCRFKRRSIQHLVWMMRSMTMHF